FDRDSRQIFPRKLTEKRKIKLAEGVHLRDAAQAHNVGARLLHERRVCRIAGEFKGEIRFYRSVNLTRTTVKNVPAAVRPLPFHNVTNATLLQLSIDFGAPMHEQHVIGAK